MILRDAVLRIPLLALLILVLLVSWKRNAVADERNVPQTPNTDTALFKLLPASQTGVDFTNTIYENDALNILKETYIYNGGGVGIGDFNNDGLEDIYFSGNMVSNKLYLNKGSLQFKDITDVAGVGSEGKWCSGVSVVDINADGWLDIYVSSTFLKDPNLRKNLLFINQGLNRDGVPTFKESAKAYGIDDDGYSTQGVFFDYDNDGDLDLYIVTNVMDRGTPVAFRPKITDGSARNTDRLYRNNGNGTFTNVSRDAGILIEGWGHAVSITDFNLDGYPDIYVSNDFVANDILYINNKDGTFTNHITDYFKHTGWSVMGTDVADINNDGLVDLVSLEMLPESNLRKKRMLMGDNYISYINSKKFDYQHQYIRNVLQLNCGMTSEGHPVFSEVGYMAGMYETDWSWDPLVADFDNDGFRDMIITNGYPRDVTDLDYISYDNGQGGGAVNSTLAKVDALPVVKISNYAFKNKGGFMFDNTTKAWGLYKPSFSNGGAYADLDNDGDLDLVINNINDPSFIYENTLQKGKEHTLTIALAGKGMNIGGIGASVRIYYNGKQQLYELQPCRGYLSTVDARAHFGLGTATTIDSMRVRWPDGKSQLLTNIKADQSITISYKDAPEGKAVSPQTAETPLFTSASSHYGIKFKHEQKDVVDFNIQPTLPHKFSQYGPGIAVGDVDNNGFDDFYIGGSPGKPGVFFMQDAKGHFSIDAKRFIQNDIPRSQELGVLLFDADNDKDLDLYVVTGSYELPADDPANQDRLYLNNGKGKFIKSTTALPKMLSDGSCVRAADIDGDGDLDLFVGGRVVSGAYPLSPKSYILRNQNGKFTDVTRQYSPQLQSIGMITDALWSDFDNDGKPDLVLTGEWMPVTFLKNTGHSLVSVNTLTGIDQHTGWWNSLVSGDFDNDGDIDYVAGNLGLNSNFKATPAEPMTMYAKDFDNNGLIDPMLFCYLNAEDSSRKPFPMHAREDMISQMISMRKRYPTFKAFGVASMDDLWSAEDKENAVAMRTVDLNTSYIENKGNGKFVITPLPIEAQAAPVYGMASNDVDGDGNEDLLLVGNDYGMEPGSGRHDAFMGLCLKGDGKGNFSSMTIAKSGFFVKGDAKGLAAVHTAKNEDLLVATQNQDSLMVYSKANQGETAKWVNLNSNDFYADITYRDNKKRRIEFYYGSTYLSQSSRKLKLDKDAAKITITDFKGNKREVNN